MAKIDSIVKWGQSVSREFDGVVSPPLVAHLFEACSELFSEILLGLINNKTVERPVLLSLKRSHNYLVLWADGYGVSSGWLDTNLDRSQRARRLTLRLLLSICHTLIKRT